MQQACKVGPSEPVGHGPGRVAIGGFQRRDLVGLWSGSQWSSGAGSQWFRDLVSLHSRGLAGPHQHRETPLHFKRRNQESPRDASHQSPDSLGRHEPGDRHDACPASQWGTSAILATQKAERGRIAMVILKTDNHLKCQLVILKIFYLSFSHKRYTVYLEIENHTLVSAFTLQVLSDYLKFQPLLFVLFLSTYLITVFGNLLIILATIFDSHLHIPLYFFLSNLSFVDICFISTTVPKILVNIQTQNKEIFYRQCLTQVYFLNTFTGMDNFLLTELAYDRFVAICYPLNYTVIMNPCFCVVLLLLSWIIMFCVSLTHILLMNQLNFSISTEIPHFYCELAQVLKVSSSNTSINSIFIYLMTALLGVFPISGILYSYFQIVSSLMRMSSISSKYKAFSTCGAHLSVVFLFYGTALWVYLSSDVTHSSQDNMIASVMYTVVTPMLNPFIYSLRNKDVKGALGRLLSKAASSLSWITDLRIKGT
ncbi:olfactory receptor 7D4-like [Castor canadensis]|uniref:Olfactory receptor 7D4-like n=1 Tax=Castor canadensis TaxID=51338 RepID=A0AC58KX21_CASCN